MRSIANTAVLLAFVLSVGACGLASDMADAQKNADAVALGLERELGVKPLIGWNIHNGTLRHVNVSFPVESVAKMNVGDLDAKVRAAVNRGFEKPPEQVVVSTVSSR